MALTAMNLIFSWGLLVLIWLVQIIIYPGFHRVPSEDFRKYHAWYVKRITVIVLPLMIGEVAAVALWFATAASMAAVMAAVLVAVVWAATFLLQVPIHRRLSRGKQTNLINRLTATNWIRTIAWSLKALLVTVLAARQLF